MKDECTACDGSGWIYAGDYPCGPQCCGAKYDPCKDRDGTGKKPMSHNERVIYAIEQFTEVVDIEAAERVIYAIEQLNEVVDIEAAISWMLTHNPQFNAKPIDMVDERYEELLGVINLLQEGNPE